MNSQTSIRVGIGGWTFAPWRDNFYPKGLVQRRELEFASRHVTAIEINGTYYGTQKPATYAKWRDETPEGFVFSAKAPKRIMQSRSEESVLREVRKMAEDPEFAGIVSDVLHDRADVAAVDVAYACVEYVSRVSGDAAGQGERAAQSHLLRDIFGNPFREEHLNV